MPFISRQDVGSPLVTDHGEVIYELIGRGAGQATERHSLAVVVLPPGKASLLHSHPEAEESYFILRGHARMILGEEEAVMEPGQAVLIQPPTPHKIINIGDDELEFLAVCVPAWEPTNTEWLEDGTAGNRGERR